MEAPEATPEGQPQPELYELPDGRKVDAQTVLNEYKNLQSDYTRKSQELSSLKNPQHITNDNNTPEYKKPDWIPESYNEIIEKAKEEIYRDMESKAQAERAVEEQLANEIDTQLAEVKKLDPNVNENKLFEHATKYGIPNLVNAFNSMKDMNKVIETTRQQTIENAKKRTADPVSGQPGQAPVIDEADIYDPRASTRSLLDHLRSLKK